jgi:O-antigen ligase
MITVVAAPFPYGGITLQGSFAIELLAFLTLAATFAGNPSLARLSGVKVPLIALAGVVLLGVLQLLPVPGPLLAMLSPASAQTYRDAATVLARFHRPAPMPRISIAPTETIDTILLTLAYVALFVSSALLLRSRNARRAFIIVLLAAAAIHILIGTATRVFWQGADDPSSGRLHGAFINANHFSAYLEIMLALAFGALWREVLHVRGRDRHFSERGRRFESHFMRVSTRVLVWGLFAAAIALTKSRAGILVAVVATLMMVALGLAHRRVRNERYAVAVFGSGALAAGLAFVAMAARQQPILRFLASDPRDPASDLRPTLWRLSVLAWKNFPIIGSGLGTFREAFRRVQPPDFDYLVEFAHSDPLQLLVTGGVIGFLLGMTAFLMIGVRLYRRWRRDQRREETAFMLAGLGALFSIALHGLVEFNLSIPAVPATLAAVLGLAWAATYADENRPHRVTEVTESRP